MSSRKWGVVEEKLAREFEEAGKRGVGIKLIPQAILRPSDPSIFTP